MGMNKINTKNYEDIISAVKIDDRETDRKEYALNQYSSLNPSLTHLDSGDYIFIGKNGVKVVFEYKKEDDFISSIVDNPHLHNQTYKMITNYDYSFIIVQCADLISLINDRYYTTGQDISISQINGAVAELSTVSTVLFTQTQYQAFDLMMRVAGKIIRQKPFRYNYGKKSVNSALNYLSGISGIDNLAENICKKLNLRCLDDLLKVSKEELMTVDLIGEKKADKILDEINRGRYYELSKDEKQTRLSV